ncbi:hypothetical protein POX_c03980 [Penicillium oxalicum]|uniref:hypothetical protein n=1 Tax=Penicillium oxalicum TaxID=69781 RepID=UPI0020B727B9|nr:hypothetical protein POX_c03980 [Penicillium oxalicum]KAI2791124.1 hypothetical protein POX_c03980 [Penicillium oxalicum]
MSSSGKEGAPSRRRESRSGSRKVSLLSAEQLERKRAMDREAQRSIRQRTKEHIEQLEQQVTILRTQVDNMRSQNQQFDDLVRQNATLQDEIARLKTQLASFTGPPSFTNSHEQAGHHRTGWDAVENSNGSAPIVPPTNTILSPQFPPPPPPPLNHPLSTRLPRATSSLSMSSRSPHPHEWQPSYSSTRSSSIGESSDPEYPPRMESYTIEGHLQQQQQQSSRMVAPTVPLVSPQMSFSSAGGTHHSGSEPSFGQGFHMSQHSGPGSALDGLPSMGSYPSAHRTMSLSMPVVSAPSPGHPTTPYPSGPSPYPTHPGQAQQRDPSFSYPWNPQS